jgi:DNA-binding phage protein
VEPGKISDRTRKQIEALPPEKRAAAEAIVAGFQTPEYREREALEREALDREVRETGMIRLKDGGAFVPIPREPDPLIAALRQAREAAGISMGEVARRTGIDLAALSRLENGQHANPTLLTIRRYLAALGKRLEWNVVDL